MERVLHWELEAPGSISGFTILQLNHLISMNYSFLNYKMQKKNTSHTFILRKKEINIIKDVAEGWHIEDPW